MDIVLRDHPALKANLENAAVKNYGSLGTDLTSQLGSFHETGPALVIGILLTFFGARGVANACRTRSTPSGRCRRRSGPGSPGRICAASG
jgi:hypothetical protein